MRTYYGGRNGLLLTPSMALFLEMINVRDRLSLLSLLSRWAPSSSLSFPTSRSFSLSSAALASRKKRMPPKKAPAQEKKVLLGRPSNNLKIGIVGMFILMICHSPFKAIVVS